MTGFAARRCVRHAAREAVGRCSACGEHFCRECVGEHGGVLLCAPCLARQVAQQAGPRAARWRRVGDGLLTVAAGLLLWVIFYSAGQLLKAIPPDVHEGTVWRRLGGD